MTFAETVDRAENNTPVPFDGYTISSPNVAYSVGRYSWQKQEAFKGRTASDDTVTAWLTSSDQAGWGFWGTNALVWTPSVGYVSVWWKMYTLRGGERTYAGRDTRRARLPPQPAGDHADLHFGCGACRAACICRPRAYACGGEHNGQYSITRQ